MAYLLEKSVAHSSRQLYQRSWTLLDQCYHIINQSNNLILNLPLSNNHIAVFVAYLHDEGYAPASIVSYVSAIAYVHKLLGLPDPTSANIVQKLIAGATKVYSPKPSRLPITIIILHRIILGIDEIVQVHYHKILLKAMFTTAFFGLMRIGEVTMSKHKSVPLLLDQLQLNIDQAVINITHFKHNKSNKPVPIPLQRQDNYQICPVYNISQYLLLRGRAPGPLFAFPGPCPVPREFFSKHLKQLISLAGYDIKRYQAHSFRIGGASYYAELGYTDAQLRLLGRWGSNAFIRYIRNIRVTAAK